MEVFGSGAESTWQLLDLVILINPLADIRDAAPRRNGGRQGAGYYLFEDETGPAVSEPRLQRCAISGLTA